MKGLIVKKHSNFYYVKVSDNKIYECMLRERLKKEHQEVLVGDYVELEEPNDDTLQAVISTIEDRISYISRPNIANMQQNIIVMALNKPAIDLNQLDRFVIHTLIAGLKPVICINKCDLKDKKQILPVIRELYPSLGIDVLEVSAINCTGLDTLKELLKDKKNVFSGPSGVGKSTIINALKPGANLRVGNIGAKSNKGTHTTRHSELVYIDIDADNQCIIADTPGFSYLKFDKYLPDVIEKQFLEFEPYRKDCYYNDCIHLNEAECGVKNNLDKISDSRYDSYCKFVSEALEYKDKLYSMSTKEESITKAVNSSGKNDKQRLKLGYNLVEQSRKSYKQKLSSISSSDNTEDLYDDSID
ncbi:MAG: ribosome small subunit-dependent GTPase A [Vampirovibrionia bacterium]